MIVLVESVEEAMKVTKLGHVPAVDIEREGRGLYDKVASCGVYQATMQECIAQGLLPTFRGCRRFLTYKRV